MIKYCAIKRYCFVFCLVLGIIILLLFLPLVEAKSVFVPLSTLECLFWYYLLIFFLLCTIIWSEFMTKLWLNIRSVFKDMLMVFLHLKTDLFFSSLVVFLSPCSSSPLSWFPTMLQPFVSLLPDLPTNQKEQKELFLFKGINQQPSAIRYHFTLRWKYKLYEVSNL